MNFGTVVDSERSGSYSIAVGRASLNRMRRSYSKRAAHGVLYFIEYIGYLSTLYILMVHKVLRDYPQVHHYSIRDWARHLPLFDDYVLFVVLFLFLYTFMRIQAYLFSGQMDRSLSEECWRTVRSIGYSFLVTIGISFLLKTTTNYSRVALITFVVAAVVEAILWRGIDRFFVRYLNRQGMLRQRVLIVGAGRIGAEIRKKIDFETNDKYSFVGFLDDSKTDWDILGSTRQLEKVIQEQEIDVVYITLPSERELTDSLLHTIYKYNLDIRIIPEMYNRTSTIFAFRKDLDYPCMQIVKSPLRGLNVILKRVADIVVSALLIVSLSPIAIAIGLWIKADSAGPVFYKQQRVGKNGVPFPMLKFRSMKLGAERLRKDLELKNDATGPVFKMKKDPRITKFGKFLRKYSLDELPQLWNVFIGQMSLIGPRPALPEEVSKYTDYQWRRLDVLPGMTGLWQVSGRSDLDFSEWIDLDIQYIEAWSFTLEMKIMFKTIPVVIKGTGAY